MISGATRIPSLILPSVTRPHKYGVSPAAHRTYDGITFDSKAEMNRYLELRALVQARVIRDLRLQVKYVLLEKFRHPVFGVIREISYVADFVYIDQKTGMDVVEDVKGAQTPVYRIKRALLLHRYPDMDFREVSA